jgi:putative tricarboxylic transport membrane protein
MARVRDGRGVTSLLQFDKGLMARDRQPAAEMVPKFRPGRNRNPFARVGDIMLASIQPLAEAGTHASGEDALKLGWLIATGLLVCIFGTALWLGVWGFAPLNARPLPLKDALGPGPGFFPMWLSIIGIALGSLLLIETAREPAAPAGTPSLVPERDALLRICAIVVLLAGAALSLDPLGFRITAFGFTFLALLALGIRSVLALLVFALLSSVGVFHVFYHWLKVPLPIGPYDYLLKPLGL